MKKRVEKLEKLSSKGIAGIYLLTSTDDGNYKYWDDKRKDIFTPKEVEALKDNLDNHVLIIEWGYPDSE